MAKRTVQRLVKRTLDLKKQLISYHFNSYQNNSIRDESRPKIPKAGRSRNKAYSAYVHNQHDLKQILKTYEKTNSLDVDELSRCIKASKDVFYLALSHQPIRIPRLRNGERV